MTMNESTHPMQDGNEEKQGNVSAFGERPGPNPAHADASNGHLSTADVANALQSPQAGQDTATSEREDEHLLPADRLGTYRDRWQSIQITFVDEPKASVEQADSLVAEVIQTLAQRFAEERDSLEHQWSGGGEASTEDMRLALQHYRTFFERLLAA